MQPPLFVPPRCFQRMRTLLEMLPVFWSWQEPLLPCPASYTAGGLAVSVITRLALRMFSGLSFTVMVSLYSATRSLSKGRFT